MQWNKRPRHEKIPCKEFLMQACFEMKTLKKEEKYFNYILIIQVVTQSHHSQWTEQSEYDMKLIFSFVLVWCWENDVL